MFEHKDCETYHIVDKLGKHTSDLLWLLEAAIHTHLGVDDEAHGGVWEEVALRGSPLAHPQRKKQLMDG